PNVVGLDPASAEALIGAADLSVGAITHAGGAITLNFDTLPRAPGGRDGTTYSRILEKQVVFLGSDSLRLHTIGAGTTANRYFQDGVVDARLPFSITVTARMLAEEPPSTLPGFQANIFAGRDLPSGHVGESMFGLGVSRVYGVGGDVLTSTIDGT